MLNKSCLHLNENSTERSVSNYNYRLIITNSRNSNNQRNHKDSFLSINECSNAFESVKAHRLQTPENVIIGHLNFNSLRNK